MFKSPQEGKALQSMGIMGCRIVRNRQGVGLPILASKLSSKGHRAPLQLLQRRRVPRQLLQRRQVAFTLQKVQPMLVLLSPNKHQLSPWVVYP